MKTFVTGATGFVGSHLTQALLARGDTVRALARRPAQHEALRAMGAEPVAGSLENERGLLSALDGVEVVYHVAGLTAAPSEAEFFAVNDAGTRRLLEAARRAASGLVRFVYVSSQAALGPSPRGAALTEEAECRPLTAYGRSKLAGELAVRGSGLPWSVVRPPAVYGPRDRAFLPLFRIVRRGIAPIFGTGTQTLTLVYVVDLAQALVEAGTRIEANNEVFHAAHPAVVHSRDIARLAGQALGRSPVIVPVPALVAVPLVKLLSWWSAVTGQANIVEPNKVAEFLAPSWVLSVAKAERLLGWRAQTPLSEGLALTAEWYRKEGWLP